MEQKYNKDDNVVFTDNGKKVIGKILGATGKGIFRKYAVGFERTDPVMGITYRTSGIFREKELQELSVQNSEVMREAVIKYNTIMEILGHREKMCGEMKEENTKGFTLTYMIEICSRLLETYHQRGHENYEIYQTGDEVLMEEWYKETKMLASFIHEFLPTTQGMGMGAGQFPMYQEYVKHSKEIADELLESNFVKTKKRNMLLGFVTILFAIVVMPYSIKTDNLFERVWIIALTVTGLTTGVVLLLCEWKAIQKMLGKVV